MLDELEELLLLDDDDELLEADEALVSLELEDCDVRSSLLLELLETSPSESSTQPCASRMRNSTASSAVKPVQ